MQKLSYPRWLCAGWVQSVCLCSVLSTYSGCDRQVLRHSCCSSANNQPGLKRSGDPEGGVSSLSHKCGKQPDLCCCSPVFYFFSDHLVLSPVPLGNVSTGVSVGLMSPAMFR
ncbi:hypothetical protein CHARACLAT_022312 [Characodon lateralis]|uniref:Secreted protein n=1 Tax=Characodon lateralis TaxID=208331 RepID=A0ABU7DIU4_9TELE|nr:hypothetical protein [Characodon lateralis]